MKGDYVTSRLRPVSTRQDRSAPRVKRLLLLLCPLVLCASGLSAQRSVFEGVKIYRHRSADDRALVDKFGTLTFDDSARKVTFSDGSGDRIEVGYDDVGKVVLEITTRMRGGTFAQVAKVVGAEGMIVGTALARPHVDDHWFYMEFKDQGRSESALLEIPKNCSAPAIEKANQVFGSRVSVPDFPQKSAEIQTADLKAYHSEQTLKIDKQNHPLPEVKPDKATIVVVCPALIGHFQGKKNRFRLHANDQVIAVNELGTYSFAYLDPGKYRLVSQTENANGFEMELAAGQEYYFVQNAFHGNFKPKTSLSRNSQELVSYLVQGSYFSDWKAKEK